MKTAAAFAVPVLLLALGLAGCGGSFRTQAGTGRTLSPCTTRMAILPLVNLTTMPHAGRVSEDILATEVYAWSGFQILERGQMMQALNVSPDEVEGLMDTAVALDMGRRLGVDAVLFGSVSEFRYKKGLDEDPVVGLNLRLLDVASNRILWAESASASGSPWTGTTSLNLLTQKVASTMVRDMLEQGQTPNPCIPAKTGQGS